MVRVGNAKPSRFPAWPPHLQVRVQEWPSNPWILPTKAPVAFAGNRLITASRNSGYSKSLPQTENRIWSLTTSTAFANGSETIKRVPHFPWTSILPELTDNVCWKLAEEEGGAPDLL
jgi:hypothetical protein